jgi:heterodisulfide reductase subunit A-like polyferredoxin
VIVIGGGIGGIQCALDLAETGFYVYLLDKTHTLGGTMARLDKTFPTNDCSTCMFSPKLVQAAGNPNIEIIPSSRLLNLAGEPGRFTARIEKSRGTSTWKSALPAASARKNAPRRSPMLSTGSWASARRRF